MAPVKYLRDYISGTQVRAREYEVAAVQVFARRLVEVYGYPKSHLHTHPAWHVTPREGKEPPALPVDVAVFSSPEKTAEHLRILAVCRESKRSAGLRYLKRALRASGAPVGVWFNGAEHQYLYQYRTEAGQVKWEDLPDIPRAGQHPEEVGVIRKQDLRAPTDLQSVFTDIRNHLAGNATGISRDEPLAVELINLLFCKLYDETQKAPEEVMAFRAGFHEPPRAVRTRVLGIFAAVKSAFPAVFDKADRITLDARSLVYVVGELQNYSIATANRDVLGGAFEKFIGPALKGSQGQFFTPRNVILLAVNVIGPRPGERVIDPACGSGGFLTNALDHVWATLERQQETEGWPDARLTARKHAVGEQDFSGVDKDAFLAKVTRAYLAIVGTGHAGIFCTNSLLPPDQWPAPVRARIKLGGYDVLFTNPPFGSKIKVKDNAVLEQYELAYKWRYDRKKATWQQGKLLKAGQSPQLLFIERCHALLREGGRMAIILPETIFGMPKYKRVVHYLLAHFRVLAFVSLPEELFQPHTHAKTCLVCLQKGPPPSDYPIFFAIARWCGHDSMGRPTLRQLPGEAEEVLMDDVPEISANYTTLVRDGAGQESDLGFLIRRRALKKAILIPKYYDPTITAELARLEPTHDLVTLGELRDQGLVSISAGHEVGKMAYGTGDVPFFRTSDITNWELKIDPKKRISEAIYKKYRAKQDVQALDILLVRDGTYLVGTSCLLTEDDTRMVFCSGIYKIRVEDHAALSPYLVFALLNSEIVKRQIRAKQFTREIIDTLGKRVYELVLPVPKDARRVQEIVDRTRHIIQNKKCLMQEKKDLIAWIHASGEAPL